MDLRRRKTGDIPPDRTETRPEPGARSAGARWLETVGPRARGPEPEVNIVQPYGNPKPETRPVLRWAGDWPRSAQVTDRSQSETAAVLTLTEGRKQPGAVNMRYNNCVSQRSRGRPVFGDGNRTNSVQLRKKIGMEQKYFHDLAAMTRQRLCISFQDWTGAALNRSIQGLIDHVDIGSVSTEQLLEQLKATLQLSQSVATVLVRWHYLG